MFRKLFLSFIIVFSIVTILFSCGKKENTKEIIYNGSVMLYTNIDAEILKKIKEDFESTYKGIVLDYFNNNVNEISNKLEESFDLDLPEADIVICEDSNLFNRASSKKWFNLYESKEDKYISEDYKLNDKDYYIVFSKENDNFMMGLVSNSLNVDNGHLLVDYLLSKKGQELLVNNGLKSVRNDIK